MNAAYRIPRVSTAYPTPDATDTPSLTPNVQLSMFQELAADGTGFEPARGFHRNTLSRQYSNEGATGTSAPFQHLAKHATRTKAPKRPRIKLVGVSTAYPSGTSAPTSHGDPSRSPRARLLSITRRLVRRLRAPVCVLAALLTGCVESTSFGHCVGLNGHERPDLVYEYSAQNIIVGAIAFELIYPPVKVALDELKCPVAVRGEGGAR